MKSEGNLARLSINVSHDLAFLINDDDPADHGVVADAAEFVADDSKVTGGGRGYP